MSASTVSINAAEKNLDAVLSQLVESVRQRIPEVQCQVHHGLNSRFPWWIVARLSNPAATGKVVDVSIECHTTGGALEIRADLALEDGTVLQEYEHKENAAPATHGANSSPSEDAVRGVRAFLLSSADPLAQQLAVP